MGVSICELFIWFTIIAVGGWLWESAYCTIVEHGWQNRGFLFGPVCPIYGAAALSITGRIMASASAAVSALAVTCSRQSHSLA